MVERCNRTLLVILRAVVSEWQDDWNDHFPSVLSAYRDTPIAVLELAHIGSCMAPKWICRLTWSLEGWVEKGPRSTVHVNTCSGFMVPSVMPTPWPEPTWRRLPNGRREAMDSPADLWAFDEVIGCGMLTHLSVWGKLHYWNRGPWLVLAKTGPVTYKTQCYAEADPEIVHVNKLVPYQADFGEELQSSLQSTESTGHRFMDTQTCDFVPSESRLNPCRG